MKYVDEVDELTKKSLWFSSKKERKEYFEERKKEKESRKRKNKTDEEKMSEVNKNSI